LNDEELGRAMQMLDELPTRFELNGIIFGLVEEFIPSQLQLVAIRNMVDRVKEEMKKL
jgi:hypothetical protein